MNPHDFSPVSTSIGTTGVLDLPLTSLLAKVLKRGMNVVDVGANLGYYTLLTSEIVGDTGVVYAFEPESYNFRLLCKSVGENNLPNVQVYQLALSDRQGKVKLYKGDASQPQEHSITVDWGKGSEEVVSTTLDEFWESAGMPQINLVKIHVVGDDPLVLKGARKVINEMKPMLAIVFDPPKWNDEADLLHNLFALYRVYEVLESPFLIRQVEQFSLSRKKPTELFLYPKEDY